MIHGLSLGELAKYAIIIAAIIAIAWIAFRAMGVAPPAWAVRIFWVVVVAIVAIFAIGLVMRL